MHFQLITNQAQTYFSWMVNQRFINQWRWESVKGWSHHGKTFCMWVKPTITSACHPWRSLFTYLQPPVFQTLETTQLNLWRGQGVAYLVSQRSVIHPPTVYQVISQSESSMQVMNHLWSGG
ncbi:uncharacterized protein LOC124260494 [Haliotis rubra]|uniref:uncharacterized protein LOC124260494 n=1 Tax=Haliotis rubra TaxID=36100 RepID=UPI001EE5C70A|nr:uncharacterized protein LOC124260494 [Haliotis rubra]